MWMSIEFNIGIICGCVPLIRPVVNRLFPNFLAGNKNRQISPENHVATIGGSGEPNRRVQRPIDSLESLEAHVDSEKRIEPTVTV